jgi:hypothetical protein
MKRTTQEKGQGRGMNKSGKEQVRKRGLPPLFQSKQQRGQAPLPDLFYPELREKSFQN